LSTLSFENWLFIYTNLAFSFWGVRKLTNSKSNVYFLNKVQDIEPTHIELMVSKEFGTDGVIPHFSRRVKLFIMLFLVSTVGAAACVSAMLG